MSLNVLIVGGGIGGLCLAQGLHKAGVNVTVFERDASVSSRQQGYRFRIDKDGNSALQACLPPHLYELYRATTNKPSPPPVGAFDQNLNLIYRMGGGGSAPASTENHLAVNRFTLRQVLLGGLEDIVQFGHTLTSFCTNENGVEATFANGRTVTGDVLIAADGINSLIRRQMLPEAEIFDTDMRCVYGKTVLTDEILPDLPAPLHGGFTPVIGPERCTLALGLFQPCRPFAESVAALAPGVRVDPVPDYLMWMFVAPKEVYDQENNTLWASDDPVLLHRFALKRMQDWHPELRTLVEQADVPATFPVAIRTSKPVAPWPSSRVTFLGDAIHAMTPAGGIGANTAMRDAVLLTEKLTLASNDQAELIATIASYEAAMREYGFAAVTRSFYGAAQMYRISVPN